MSDIVSGTTSVGNDDEEDTGAVGDAETQNITTGTATVEPEPQTAGTGERAIFCLVCNMATMGPDGSVFIQPCRCGYWVHDQCLINVALQFEDFNPDTRSIGCKICRRAYNVSPVKSFRLRYAVKFTSIWYQTFCYMCMETFLELVADVTFIKLGSIVFKKIYGPEEAARLISSMSPLRAIFSCLLIPVASIIISNIPWERYFLERLRKCSSLPLVGGLFPMEYREVADIYKGSSNFSLNLVGGLLLPFYAVVASKLFTCCVEEPFHRFLLGGATVVLFKGICKMYYKHKKYVRYCTFTIVDSTTPKI